VTVEQAPALYSITYHPGIGSGTPFVEHVNSGASYTIKGIGGTTFTSPGFGYFFMGWGITPDGYEITYSVGQVISITQSIVLYARWYQAT